MVKIKKLTKHIIKDRDLDLTHMSDYDELDNEVALAWHPASGILVGEWMNILSNYGLARDRKLFFGVNNFGMPTCFFDASNKAELSKLVDEQSEVNRTKFMNPKKMEKDERL